MFCLWILQQFTFLDQVWYVWYSDRAFGFGLEITVMFGPVEPLYLVKVWKPLNNYLGPKGWKKTWVFIFLVKVCGREHVATSKTKLPCCLFLVPRYLKCECNSVSLYILLTFEPPQVSLVFRLYQGKLLSWWTPEHTKSRPHMPSYQSHNRHERFRFVVFLFIN